MKMGIAFLFAVACAFLASIALAADGLRTIVPKEDGPFVRFEEYAAKLKGQSYFYSVCRAERGPVYLIVPTTPAIDSALLDVYHDGVSQTATVFGNTVLRNLAGETELVEPEGGIGSKVAIRRIAEFLKARLFYFVPTGDMDELRLPDIACP